MDPLSFTASLIAVVGLAGEVVKTCKRYIDGVADYPREFRLIYIEVNSVKSILDGLTLLREDDYEDANILRSIRGSAGPIKGCEETIRELDGLLKQISAPATGRTKRRWWKPKLPTFDALAWPSRRDKAVALLKAIATHKQTINAALTASILSEVHSIKAKLDRAEQDRMHGWLVEVNPSSNHNAANRLYEEGTGDWIFRSQEWNLWVNKQSEKRSLWIHGIPGAGKTILASHIMEELIKTKCSGNVVLVYCYCYHSHNRDETFPFLRWLVSQLCRKTDTASSLTYEIYSSGLETPCQTHCCAMGLVHGFAKVVDILIWNIDNFNITTFCTGYFIIHKIPKCPHINRFRRQSLTVLAVDDGFNAVVVAMYQIFFANPYTFANPCTRSHLSDGVAEGVSSPDEYRSGQDPDVPKLLTALHAQLDGLDTVYVTVDALDESQRPRETFLGVLHTLATDPRFQKIQLLTTSREYADIERVMAPSSLSVPTSHKEVEKDIRVFVDRSISRSDDFKRWPDDLKLEVVDALAKGAQGMFRWAVCQLDLLRRLNCATSEDVRQTIKTLPKDLDETYMRILDLIHPDDLELVRFTIHWIIYTEDLAEYHARILDVSEVLSSYVLHRYGSSERANQISIPCNLDKLKDCCGCLVSFVGDQQDEENPVCKLSHYTIKEFLQSSRFKPTDQLMCLDLATMKTYLPNVILQMTIDRDGCDDEGRKDLYGFYFFVGAVLLHEEFLDHKLVFSAFLIDIPSEGRYEFGDRRFHALRALHAIKWVGDRPADEIIVLLRLLAMDALHLSRNLLLLGAAGSHLLCSSLSLIWHDFDWHASGTSRTKITFEGNVVEFIAALAFTSPPSLLFLLENYYQGFADFVDLNRILRSFQNVSRGFADNYISDLDDSQVEHEIRAKVVQKLHDLGAVSMDEYTKSDLEPDYEKDVGPKTEPTLESGGESHEP